MIKACRYMSADFCVDISGNFSFYSRNGLTDTQTKSHMQLITLPLISYRQLG